MTHSLSIAGSDELLAATPISPLYAAIDIGSNNVRGAVFGVNAAKEIVRIEVPGMNFKCRLAKGMSGQHDIVMEESIESAEKALAEIRKMIASYGVSHENTIAFATAALRAVEHTDSGAIVIDRLQKAGGPFSIISGVEESTIIGVGLAHELVKMPATVRLTGGRIAGATIGGGSTEAFTVMPSGAVRNAVEFPIGMHTLKAIQLSHEGDVQLTGRHFRKHLARAWGPQSCNILYAVGGNWDAVARILRGNRFALTGSAEIGELHALAKRSETYFERFAFIGDRATSIPILSETLYQTAQHIGAKKINFIDIKMMTAMAQILHDVRVNDRPAPHGLERLFAPSAPAPAPRA